MSVLILGGTAEARKLAEALGPQAVLSLAGVTDGAAQQGYRQRRGGFGGVDGLAAFLAAKSIGAVVDATHPFAAQMSQNAAAATTRLGLPLLRLERAAWPNDPLWQSATTLDAAAKTLPAGARVFLSVGSRSMQAFLPRADLWCLTRSIEPPARLPAKGEAILQRPPFTLEAEIALMQAHRITHLVSKNAGGQATEAKLAAAAKLGVQVIMVKRPQLPAALTVATVAEAVKWVENQGE